MAKPPAVTGCAQIGILPPPEFSKPQQGQAAGDAQRHPSDFTDPLVVEGQLEEEPNAHDQRHDSDSRQPVPAKQPLPIQRGDFPQSRIEPANAGVGINIKPTDPRAVSSRPRLGSCCRLRRNRVAPGGRSGLVLRCCGRRRRLGIVRLLPGWPNTGDIEHVLQGKQPARILAKLDLQVLNR